MSYNFFKCDDAYVFFFFKYIKHIFIMMNKYFKVSIFFFFFYSLKATFSSFKKKERCHFITKHMTDFAMSYVVSLVLIM